MLRLITVAVHSNHESLVFRCSIAKAISQRANANRKWVLVINHVEGYQNSSFSQPNLHKTRRYRLSSQIQFLLSPVM